MWNSIVLLLGLVCMGLVGAPPVLPDHKVDSAEEAADSAVKDDLAEYMEYHRYLKEVVAALESDPEFRTRLEKADADDVRSGAIAEQLDFVNHGVRSRLDEIKRRELERLRHLATRQYELDNHLDVDADRPGTDSEHLDHRNPHTFEIEDLKRLIQKTTKDLDKADKQRKDEFKEYEMHKEFEKQQNLEKMDEEHKKEFEKKIKAEEEAKKHHKPLHHPGSKQQLEEVWEKQDHMEQQFDPKAFFMMHDVDGNGVWDADEVKALFIKELDKMYGENAPNHDKRERAEEMERMREHVFSEADKNKDGLIDFNEFIQETRKPDFNKDPDWKPIDENQIYSQDEYSEYQRRQVEEIKYLQSLGLVDAYGRPIPGAEQQVHAARQAYHQQQLAYHQQQQQAWRQQQQYQPQQHYPPQGQGPPLQQHYQGQAPPQAYQGQAQPQHYQGQAPPQAYQGQAPPQGYQGQAPPQTYQGQAPQQQQYQPSAQQAYQQPPQQQQQAYQQPQQQGQAPPQQGQAPPQPVQQNQPPVQQNQPPVQQAQAPVQLNQPAAPQNPPAAPSQNNAQPPPQTNNQQ